MNEIEKFWLAFCEKHGISKESPHEAWAFGDSKELADELAQLVKEGKKTATTSAYELYEVGEEKPEVGEYNIILDGSDRPICVTQTKVVYLVPYNQITPEHAWHEGEGDRSYEYWRKVHDAFFKREYQLVGKEFYEQAPMLCEVFELIL